MRYVIPVEDEYTVGEQWGRAKKVALVDMTEDRIDEWTVVDVNWDEQHDEIAEGSHHAKIVRFLLDNKVDAVVVDHMGQGMVNTIGKLGLPIFATTGTDARASVIGAAQELAKRS